MFRKINITHPNVDDDDDDGHNNNNDNYKKAELSCFPNKGWNQLSLIQALVALPVC